MTAQWRYIGVAILLLLAGCQAGSGSLNETTHSVLRHSARGRGAAHERVRPPHNDPYTLTASNPRPTRASSPVSITLTSVSACGV